MKERIIEILFAIMHPRFWISNYSACKYWDTEIKRLIDEKAEVRTKGIYHCKIGPYTIWAANYPYAYGYTHSCEPVLARRLTRKRLRDYITKQLMSS